MSGFFVLYKRSQNAQEAFEKVEKWLDKQDSNLFPIPLEFKCDQEKKIINAMGSGSNVTLSFVEDKVEVTLNLSFLHGLFKQKIQSTLDEELKKNL